MRATIPFNKPFVAGKELFSIAQAVPLANLAGDVLFSQRCQHLLQKKLGIARVLMTPFCTAVPRWRRLQKRSA